MVSLLLALIYLAFVSLGLPDSLLGSGWPVMHLSMGVPVAYMGIVSMIISGCTIVSSLCSDRLTRRFGAARVTVTSVFLTAAALFGFSFADRFWMLTLLAVPYGLGAGAIDAALNNYVALHFSSRHMSWLHCFWGVGTILSPFIMSRALIRSTWNTGYRTVSFIQFGIALVLLCTLPVWRVIREPDTGAKTARPVGLTGALRIRGVPFLLLGFLAYCAAEATVMGWASTYMVEVKGVTEEIAAKYGSLVFIGLTFGRFVGGFVMNRLGDRRMINLGTAILAVGLILLMLPGEGVTLAVIGFVVCGLGCAPIYPCIIHSTPSNFGAENSGAIIGIQMASAYLGSTFMPPLFGWLGSVVGYGLLPYYLAVFVVLMIFMTETTFRVTRSRA